MVRKHISVARMGVRVGVERCWWRGSKMEVDAELVCVELSPPTMQRIEMCLSTKKEEKFYGYYLETFLVRLVCAFVGHGKGLLNGITFSHL